MPDYEAIRKDIYERFHDAIEKLYVSELKDQIADKDEVITALNHIIAELQSRLPKEMPDCTIVFEECEVGHGSLRGTNWIKTECPHCKIAKLNEKIAGQRKSMKAFMEDAEKFRIENVGLKQRVDHAEWLVDKYREEEDTK